MSKTRQKHNTLAPGLSCVALESALPVSLSVCLFTVSPAFLPRVAPSLFDTRDMDLTSWELIAGDTGKVCIHATKKAKPRYLSAWFFDSSVIHFSELCPLSHLIRLTCASLSTFLPMLNIQLIPFPFLSLQCALNANNACLLALLCLNVFKRHS